MKHLYLPVAAAAMLLAGCVVSVSPIYTPKELVYDPALVGTWAEDEKDQDSWTFAKADDSGYALIVADGESRSPFQAHLVQLGGHRFLDICPDASGLEKSALGGIYKTALIRGHLVLKVTQIRPTLQMQALDGDWVEKLLEKSPQALAHQKADEGDLVLTASTAALQSFLTLHWNTDGAWGDPSNLKLREH
jgi:hypothetical protein